MAPEWNPAEESATTEGDEASDNQGRDGQWE